MTAAAERGLRYLAEYQTREGWEGDTETLLFQILADLIEVCDAEHLDFDLITEEARRHLRETA